MHQKFNSVKNSSSDSSITMAHLYLPPPDGKQPPKWGDKCPAKIALCKGILDQTYPPTKTNEEIYGSNLIFRQYKWENFKTNIDNLRAALARDIGRADEDAAALAADVQLFPPVANAAQGYPIWAGSEAERRLKQDVDIGRHLYMTPKELRESRLLYKPWPLKVFSDHIQQEIRSRKTQAYWLHRDKKNSKNEPWPEINSK
jgi:hypothetical protein